MIPTTSTQWEQMDGEDRERTDGRSAPGGASLAAFPVWGVLFNWFPTFFNPFEKCILLTLFSFLSKEHVFAVFYQLFSMWPFSTRFSALFPFCPCVSLSETCFQTASLTVVIKQNQKQSKKVSVYPLFCVQWLLTTVSHDLSFWLVVICRSTGSIQMRFLRKNCGDFPYF